MVNQERFFIVKALLPGPDADFTVEGVFSVEQDALNYQSESEVVGCFLLVVVDGPVSMAVVIDEIVKGRLGALAEVLSRIETMIKRS